VSQQSALSRFTGFLPFVVVAGIVATGGCGKKSEAASESPVASTASADESWMTPKRSTPHAATPSDSVAAGTAAPAASPSTPPGTTAVPAERVVPPLPPAEPPPRPVRIRVARNEPREPTATDAAGTGIPGLTLPPGIPAGAAGGAGAMLGQVMADMEEVAEKPGFPRWERLSPFEPDRLGAWVASGPPNGATAKAMGMAISTSSRSYVLGSRTARVSINAGDVVEMAGMEFGIGMPDENTPEHVLRRIDLGGQPAYVEWWKGRGTAEVRAIVANTYQVTVEIIPADGPDQALEVARAIDIAALAQLR
jgi:hypothetical protein